MKRTIAAIANGTVTKVPTVRSNATVLIVGSGTIKGDGIADRAAVRAIRVGHRRLVTQADGGGRGVVSRVAGVIRHRERHIKCAINAVGMSWVRAGARIAVTKVPVIGLGQSQSSG